MAETWLVADLGGTNTRVGLATPEGLIEKSARSYRNAGFEGLSAILRAYLAELQPGPVSALCAGVAGPVQAGTAQLTNHDWFIDASDLRDTLGIPEVHLINDLQAQGFALDSLEGHSVTPLISGDTTQQSTRLVLGLGTGCNVAVVHRINSCLFVPPAENGHASLPFCQGQLGALISWLGETHAHRPIEAALSGPGLVNIHRWLGGGEATSGDVIAGNSDHDRDARGLFCALLGEVCGDLALAHLPMGGIYLIGGMARAIAPFLAGSEFHRRFCRKGPYTELVSRIPIFLIEDDMAALRGCARNLVQERANHHT